MVRPGDHRETELQDICPKTLEGEVHVEQLGVFSRK